MIKTIVVALDGSDHAMKAVELAAEVASQTGATLHLVHVVPKTRLAYGAEEFARTEHIDAPASLAFALAENEVIKPARAHAEEWDCRKIEQTVLNGDPVEEVVDYARRHNAQMIFAGRRGLSTVGGLLLGSFSMKLSQLAECAVVTVK